VSASYDGMIALWRTDLLSPPRRPAAVAHEPYRVADVDIGDSSENQCTPRAFYHASDVVCVSTSEWGTPSSFCLCGQRTLGCGLQL
jgi:hypothetical protein